MNKNMNKWLLRLSLVLVLVFSLSAVLPVHRVQADSPVNPQVAAGWRHTVGLKADGTVVAKGNNSFGQLNVSGWTGITQVAAGDRHTVGLKANGTVVAVGSNDDGQCDVSSWTGITQVAAGGYHTVGLKADGTVVAVGSNDDGQRYVSSWTGITQVAAGSYHTVGLKANGTVVAVGASYAGQLNVSSWTGITQVAAGESHTVGLKANGTVVAAGSNYVGEGNVSGWTGITQVAAGGYDTVGLRANGTVVVVGDNGYGQRNVSGWTGIAQVAAGYYHTVGLKADGTVVAVGSNGYGQLNVSSWTGITQVAEGGNHTVGLEADGTVVAKGNNDYGQLSVSGWTGITQVAAGDGHTVGLKTDGTVVAAGNNGSGQLNVSGWTGITQVAAVANHTMGLKADGTVVAVGDNYYGQLNVSGWTGIIRVATATNHTVGLKADGTVVAVGDNFYGELNVSGWRSITRVAAGYTHTVGLKEGGTVVVVGDNGYGQCDVSGWTGITQVAAGANHTVGLKADGTVVAVGDNGYGQCDVSSWTGITQVAAGSLQTVGLKTDGMVVAVGDNSEGQLNLIGWLLGKTNSKPVADAQSVTTAEDAAKSITLTGSDPDGDPLTYIVTTSPANGTLSGTVPNLTYTPNGNYNGTDSFKFKVNDGKADSSEAPINITINPVNDAPSFVKGADQLVTGNSARTVTGWATAISAGPANESSQALNFIVSNNNNALFSVQPAVAPNGTLTYTPAVNANGSATVTVQIHDNGGTANGGVDTSAPQTFTITVISKADTATSVASSQNPSIYGQSVTFTATVTSSGGTPAGTVQFKIDGADFGLPVALSSGSATCGANSVLPVGTHAVSAVYSGDANFNGSNSSPITQTVNKATATVTLSNLNQTYTGSPLMPTATTSPSGLTVTWTGAPQTNVGSYPVTAAVNDANYQGSATGTFTVNKAPATVTLSNLTQTYTGSALTPTATTSPSGLTVTWTGAPQTNAGSYPVTAAVNDANYQGSATGTFTVNKAATIAVVVNTPSPSVFGQTVTFTATVSSGAGMPTGTVTFSEGATTYCSSVSLNGSGQAACSTSSLSAGSHTITATYSGDGNYNGSSGTVGQTVNKANSTTGVTSGTNPSTFGQSVTFTATVSSGAGTPTGTVTFKDGATALGTGALNGSGQVTFQTSSLTAGSHSITAVYGGDANFGGSTSPVISQTVNPVAYTVTPSVGSGGSISPSAPQTVNYNQTVSFTLTPDPGYQIASVTGCNGALSGNTYSTGPITGDCSVTASFSKVNDYYVAVTGNDISHCGSEENPCRTIQYAINRCAGGETIHVGAGTYDESQIVMNKALNVLGAGSATTTIDGSSDTRSNVNVVEITAAGNVTFSGFKVKNAPIVNPTDIRMGIYVRSDVQGVTYTISNNEVLGTNDTHAEQDYGIYGSYGKETLVITHNEVTQTGANAIVIEHHEGAIEISYNNLDTGCYGLSDPIFVMTHGGLDITTLQKISNNDIDMGTGAGFTYDYRATGISFASAYTGTPGGFSKIEITDNNLFNLKTHRRGIGFWNNASGDGLGGNIIAPLISGNVITGALGDTTGSMGIDTEGLVTGAKIIQNTVTGLDFSFKGRLWNTHIATGTELHLNSFTMNNSGLVWEGTDRLNATCNWWGDASGPGGVGPGSGDKVSINVDYDPWASVSTLISVDAGIDQTIVKGIGPQSVQLTATLNSCILSGSISYIWSTGENTPSITVSPVETTTYTVTVTDEYGYIASDSVTVTVIINTTTALASSQNPSKYGQSVTFTATVTATTGTPTGTVQFRIDGGDFGSPIPLSGGKATSAGISSLSVGNHTVTADYTPSAGFKGSTGTLAGGQTVKNTGTVMVQLKDSNDNPLSGGVVQYYSGGWQAFGTTDASGQVSKELSSTSYTFSMTYGSARQEKSQNVATNSTVVFQTTKVTIELRDSANNLIDTGTVQYYSGGWRDIGATSGGQATKELLPLTYTFSMTYGSARQEKSQNVSTNPTVVFQTTKVTIQLQNSTGAPMDTGTVQYYSGGWRDIGSTSGGQATKELLPLTYTFSMTYGFARQEKSQNVSTNPTVVFQTTKVTIQLQNSTGAPMDTGTVQYYSGGWRDIGSTSGGQATKELLPLTYTFSMTYGSARQEKSQNMSTNPAVVFQTTKVTIELRDSANNLIDTGTVQYYSGGWRDIGATSGGQATKELLPLTYTFSMTYGFARQEKSQNVSTNPAVVFQTTKVTVELRDSANNLIDTGTVQYYSGGWRDIGATSGGQATKELLPLTYTFSMTYGFARQEKSQNVSTNPAVVFQTTKVTIELRDSANNLIDTGTVQYYSGGWRDIGATSGGQATKELLPLTYTFSMTYGFARQEKSQNVSTNPAVVFQTGQVHSDNGRCTNYYAGGWRAFTQDMELLPLTYTFRFNDGTPDGSYTIVAGTVNHIH